MSTVYNAQTSIGNAGYASAVNADTLWVDLLWGKQDWYSTLCLRYFKKFLQKQLLPRLFKTCEASHSTRLGVANIDCVLLRVSSIRWLALVN